MSVDYLLCYFYFTKNCNRNRTTELLLDCLLLHLQTANQPVEPATLGCPLTAPAVDVLSPILDLPAQSKTVIKDCRKSRGCCVTCFIEFLIYSEWSSMQKMYKKWFFFSTFDLSLSALRSLAVTLSPRSESQTRRLVADCKRQTRNWNHPLSLQLRWEKKKKKMSVMISWTVH